MKKILVLFISILVSSNGFADSSVIREVGTSTNLLKVITGQDANGEPIYGDLEMTEYDTNKFYAVKEVSVSSNTLIEFLVYHTYAGVTNDHNYGNVNDNDNSNGHAWIYLPGPGTYTLFFMFNATSVSNLNNSLDVIQIANVVGSDADILGQAWDNDSHTRNAMEYNPTDNKFHLYKDIETTVSKTVEYKVVTWHRTFEYDGINNNWKGRKFSPSGNNLSFTIDEGKHVIHFIYDPLTDTPSVEAKRYIDVTIGSTGLATFSCPFATDAPGSVIAYYVTGYSGTEVTTQKTHQIPATTSTPTVGTGVLLEGDSGTHRFYETSDAVTLTGNKLAGTGNGTYEAANNTTYVFAVKNGVVGFYNAVGSTTAERTYASNKAYLPLDAVPARNFWGINFGSDSSHIDGISEVESKGLYYNLQGQPVTHPTKGLYIVNGKKVVIK